MQQTAARKMDPATTSACAASAFCVCTTALLSIRTPNALLGVLLALAVLLISILLVRKEPSLDRD